MGDKAGIGVFTSGMWPVDEFGIIRKDAARDVGRSDRDVRLAVKARELTPLEPGMYVLTESLPEYDVDDAIYLLRCIAAAGDSDLPLSHESAAAVHGLDLLGPEHVHIHFAKQRRGGGRSTRYRHVHSGLPDDSVVVVNGLLVSNLARTTVDVAADRPFAQALAAVDSALALGLTAAEIEIELSRRRVRGATVVAAALRYGDGRSANPGESWSRAQMIEARLPLPDLQCEFTLLSGRTVYTDYGWDDRLVGEFDGLRKYGRDLRPGQNAEDAVVAEKIREDRLRDLVCDVARWIFADLRSGAMIPMLKHRMERAGLLS
ncbi:hypothetical protein [Gordonia sp. (in: high G+C Gram-positive bacteria)]|uniref:hypothetical protein n=1 Tax=Gordonia sp. (in: high G+C Gram-positive bacteria) TaxID=84139 RepID=UPI003F974B1F